MGAASNRLLTFGVVLVGLTLAAAFRSLEAAALRPGRITEMRVVSALFAILGTAGAMSMARSRSQRAHEATSTTISLEPCADPGEQSVTTGDNRVIESELRFEGRLDAGVQTLKLGNLRPSGQCVCGETRHVMMSLSQFLLPTPTALADVMADALAKEGIGLQPGLPGLGMLPGAVARHLADMLDISMLDVFLGAWTKAYALRKELEKSVSAPGKDFFLQLAEHEIASKHEPYLALLKDGAEIGRLKFSVSLEIVVQAAMLRIRDGAIQEIEAGRVKGKGTVKCGRVKILEKALEPISLPGSIAVGPRAASGSAARVSAVNAA